MVERDTDRAKERSREMVEISAIVGEAHQSVRDVLASGGERERVFDHPGLSDH